MGLAKGAQILSAFELAWRHLLKATVKITVAQDVLPPVAPGETPTPSEEFPPYRRVPTTMESSLDSYRPFSYVWLDRYPPPSYWPLWLVRALLY